MSVYRTLIPDLFLRFFLPWMLATPLPIFAQQIGGYGESPATSPVVGEQSGRVQYQLPLPILPGRAGTAPDLQMSYLQTQRDVGAGFGVGWTLTSSAITIQLGEGLPAHDYWDRMDEKGDYKFRLALDDRRLRYISTDFETQSVTYELEQHSEQIRIIRHDREFTFNTRNRVGNLEPVTLPAGFEVLYPDGHRQMYSGDPAVAEGRPLEASSPDSPLVERYFIAKWPLVYDIQPGGESIRYHYLVLNGRSTLTEVSFAGGRSRYVLDWNERDRGPKSYAMGFPQESRILYSRLTACFDDVPEATWVFIYDSIPSADFSAAVCRPTELPRHIDTVDAKAKENEGGSVVTEMFASTWDTIQQGLNSARLWLDQLGVEGLSDRSQAGSVFLNKIHRFGKSVQEPTPGDSNRQPTLTFSYSPWALQMSSSPDHSPSPLIYEVTGFKQVTGFGVNGNSDLFDVNSDGLLDLVRFQDGKSTAYLNENLEFDQTNFTASLPFIAKKQLAGSTKVVIPRLNESSAAGEIFLQGDINGDGWEDIVSISSDKRWSAYLRDPKGSAEFVASEQSILVKENDQSYELKAEKELFEAGKGLFLDVSGDGRSDIIFPTLGSDAKVKWTLLLNTTRIGERRIRFEKKSFDFPFYATDSSLLKESSYRFADMNGDGLIDFVRIVALSQERRGLCVYENLGQSAFNQGSLFAKSSINNREVCATEQFYEVPDLESLEGRINQLWVIDVNQDGLQDFVDLQADGESLHYWLAKVGAAGFERRQTIKLNDVIKVDPVNKYNSRVVDLDQDGVQEILIFQKSDSKVKIIDFNRQGPRQNIPAGLLHSVMSEQGLHHDLAYTTAHQELLQERLENPELRWAKKGPPHSELLLKHLISSPSNRVEDQNLESFRYRDFYWDEYYAEPIGYRRVGRKIPGAYHQTGGLSQKGRIIWTSFDLDPELPEQNRQLGNQVKEKVSFETEWSEEEERLLQNRILVNIPQKSGEIFLSKEDNSPWSADRMLQRESQVQRLIKTAAVSADPESPNQKPGYYINRLQSQVQVCDDEVKDCELARSETLDFQFDEQKERLSSFSKKSTAVAVPFSDPLPMRWIETIFEYDTDSAEKLGITLNVRRKSISSLLDSKPLEEVVSTFDSTFGKVSSRKIQTFLNFSIESIPAPLRDGVLNDDERILNLSYTYDTFGNVLEASDSTGLLSRAHYDAASGVFMVMEENALGHQTHTCFSKSDCLMNPKDIAVELPDHGIQPALHFKASGDWQYLQYDDLGRPQHTKSALGLSQKFSYLMGTQKAPSMVMLEETFAETQGYLKASLQAFDSLGQQFFSMNNASPNRLQILQSDAYNRRGIRYLSHLPVLAEGTVAEYFGKQSLPTLAAEEGHRLIFDGLGRMIQDSSPGLEEVATIVHHSYGESTFIKRRDGRSIKRQWAGRSRDQIEAIEDEQGSVHRFTRDSTGLLSSAQFADDPSPRTFGYDTAGRLLYSHIPGVQSRLWTFDARGQPIESRILGHHGSEPLRELQFSYDLLNRLTLVADHSQEKPRVLKKYIYDRAQDSLGQLYVYQGGLVAALAMDENQRFHSELYVDRDRSGNPLLSKMIYKSPDGNIAQVFQERKSFRPDGLLSTLSTGNAVDLSYSYDLNGSLLNIVAKLPWENSQDQVLFQADERHASGKLERADYADHSLLGQWQFDSKTLRVKRNSICKIPKGADPISSSCESFVKNEDMLYTAEGMLANRSDRLSQAISSTVNFGYNLRGELTQEENFSGTQKWNYSPGSHLVLDSAMSKAPLPADPLSPLLPRGTPAAGLVIDGFGRIAAYDGIKALRYSSLDMLNALETSSSSIEMGRHADASRSYKRTQTGGQIDLVLTPFANTTVGTREKTTVIELPGEVWALIDHNQQQIGYALSDNLGTLKQELDAKGNVVKSRTISAYGVEQKVQTKSEGRSLITTSPIDFAGHRRDLETNWIDMNNRFYIPSLGRFTSPDPYFIRNPEECIKEVWQECQLYGYAFNNPVTFIDRNGLTGSLPNALKSGTTRMSNSLSRSRSLSLAQSRTITVYRGMSSDDATAPAAISGSLAGRGIQNAPNAIKSLHKFAPRLANFLRNRPSLHNLGMTNTYSDLMSFSTDKEVAKFFATNKTGTVGEQGAIIVSFETDEVPGSIAGYADAYKESEVQIKGPITGLKVEHLPAGTKATWKYPDER